MKNEKGVACVIDVMQRSMVVLLGVVTAFQVCPAQDLPKTYTEDVGGLKFEMVLIPGGKFKMGSPDGETDRTENEGPVHEVELSPFYLCTKETSMELFTKYYEETVRPGDRDKDGNPISENQKKDVDGVTGPTPVYGDLTMGWGAEGRPAIAMTWENAMFFCQWLSKKTGKTYRLPTEAEWEFACRAGTTTAFYFGDDAGRAGEYAWFEDNSDERTHPCGEKKPNAWGLYDMAGNVREWVVDVYGAEYYGKSPAKDPTGPAEGKLHVARGGAWDSPPEELRSAARCFEEDWWRSYDPQWPKSKWWLPKIGFIGFRVARSAGGK
ncbi:MAG: formylglycine-generating enzyme family protein [Planctomycetes bacterium]|nr:formylglycine-generating enzyme family protein [Planctomycetota bacterium]